jgi:hypothetical protein
MSDAAQILMVLAAMLVVAAGAAMGLTAYLIGRLGRSLRRLARGAVHSASHERDRYGATCNCEVPMNGGMKGGSVMKLPSVPV